MTTDQIQSKLYAKADKLLLGEVHTGVGAFRKWLYSKGLVHESAHIRLNEKTLVHRDGSALDAAFKNSLRDARFFEEYATLIDQMEINIFNSLQQKFREAYVTKFVEEVSRLRVEIDLLQEACCK